MNQYLQINHSIKQLTFELKNPNSYFYFVEIAIEKKLNYFWLGVLEKNVNAIYFYVHHGFIEFDKYIFYLRSDEQIDILMKLNLKYA
ncbi:MAG TPA: hypothetical protein PK323_12490 [Bacteroidia bacterium]|nr:hypothetical protein [Bacteroidia bacterium]